MTQKQQNIADTSLDELLQLTPLEEDPALSTEQTIHQLSEEDQERVRALTQHINPYEPQSALNYGFQAQEKLHEFSNQLLQQVPNYDTGEVGETIKQLMVQLNTTSPEELVPESSSLFQRMFSKMKRSSYEMTAKYQKIGVQIDQIAQQLAKSQQQLFDDYQQLEQLYEQNKRYFEALNLYIIAGEQKQLELDTHIIPQKLKEAQETQDPLLIQEVDDLRQFSERLHKRIHDLKLARQITIQQAPQIRIMQNTQQALAEKIQTSIHTSIPLWKNQVVIALTLLRQKEALTLQKNVTDTTNQLLKQNASMLKQSAIEGAKESERGIVDLETLAFTQNELLETLQETLAIQTTGREKRVAIEQELFNMEQELHKQLLEATASSKQYKN